MPDSQFRWLQDAGNTHLVRRGLRGVEKETLRVDQQGQLSKRQHPRALGSALTHPHLTTDYSEALLEFVTPPYTSNSKARQFLLDLHTFVHQNLDQEMLWPSSMPCILNADESVPIAKYGSSNGGKLRTVYRNGLGFRYGRAMQAIAGAHFNFSLPAVFWPAYHAYCGGGAEPDQFQSDAMMGLVRNYQRLAWIVTYLFGASPAFCKSFKPQGHERLEEFDADTWYAPHATSLRMSDLGYRNSSQARLAISTNSLDEYVAGLLAAITTPDPRYEAIGISVGGEFRQLNANILQIENEYYSSVRPKPGDRTIRPVAALARDGVEYVEVRTLDLNPEDPAGISMQQMQFLEMLLIHCVLADSPPILEAERAEIDARDLHVAWVGRSPGCEIYRDGRSTPLQQWGRQVIDQLEPVAALLDDDSDHYAKSLRAARDALDDPQLTPSARLLDTLRSRRLSFFHYGLEIAAHHHHQFLSLSLDADRQAELADSVRQSLEATQSLEAQPQQAFTEYLHEYLRV